MQTNALAALTIASYFTVIIPIGLAAAYGASLYGRVEVKKVPTEQDQKTRDIKDAVLKTIDDEAELLALIKDDADAFKRASTILKQDEEFMLEAITVNVEILAHNPDMTDNPTFMQKAVAKVPTAIQYASFTVDNENVLIDLIKYDADAFKRASKRLKQNEEFMLKAIAFNVEILAHNSYMTNDPTFMLKAIKITPEAFQYVPYNEKFPFTYANLAKEALKYELDMAEYISDKCSIEALKIIFRDILPFQINYLKGKDFPKAKQILAKASL